MLKQALTPLLFTAFLCSGGGYLYGRHVANEAHEAQQAKAVATAEQTLRKHFAEQLTQADTSVKQLRQQKAHLSAKAKKLEQEIAHAARTDCVFSAGFVGVYNRAIGAADMPATGATTGTDRAATATQPSHPNPSTPVGAVNQQDLLRHVVDYGGQCQALAAQLNALIDYLEQNDESRRTP